MPKLHLTSSLCKDCGICCYTCEHHNSKTGCTNDEYRLNSRCTSFPLLYGDSEKMGHMNFWNDFHCSSNSERNSKWFIFNHEHCLIQQHDILFNNLRWLIEEINKGNEINFYVVKYHDIELTITKEE
ncbi:MAG: hypothetical protein HGN29_05405 [Asgard group archaeon]|nr:hypothetical protein [Asgard group archaeon]